MIIILQANLNFNKKNCQVLVKFIDKFHIKIAGELAHLLINDSSISESKLANLFEEICKGLLNSKPKKLHKDLFKYLSDNVSRNYTKEIIETYKDISKIFKSGSRRCHLESNEEN